MRLSPPPPSSSSILTIILLLLPLLPSTSATTDSKPPPQACTIHSPSTGSYYDLRPLDLSLQQTSKPSKDSRTDSWHARGYDYPANFSLNICGPVIEPLTDVTGIPESRWQNISAFYRTENDKTYSIGQSNSELVFRGRKLLLNYTNGSPCPDLDENGNPKPRQLPDLRHREIIGGDDNDDNNNKNDKNKNKNKPPSPSNPHSNRQKTTLISLICDRDPTLSTHPSLSFLGSPDHCIYIFEARSRYFCGGATSSSQPGSLGPGGVFGVIIAIALLAYLVGGCAYQRIVMRQRGWRQCPNYAVWMGLLDFVKDILTILFAPCTRNLHHIKLPTFNRAFNNNNNNHNNPNRFSSSSRRPRAAGYHRVGEDGDRGLKAGGGGNASAGTLQGGGAGGRDERAVRDEEENRLIDRLDEEEWED